MSKLRRWYRAASILGIRRSLLHIVRKVLQLSTEIDDAKMSAQETVVGMHGNTVSKGVFKGLKLPPDSGWGHQAGYTAKLLGHYENEVQSRLQDLSQFRRAGFVDVGAAEGFFALGMLVSGLANKTIAFESNHKSREALKSNAKLNQVADLLEVQGEATRHSLVQAVSELGECLVLIDIEGGEYNLLDDSLLSTLASATFIVELHAHLDDENVFLQEELIARCERHFNVSFFTQQNFNVNGFQELSKLHDDVRLLALSEGRRARPLWMQLEPRGEPSRSAMEI